MMSSSTESSEHPYQSDGEIPCCFTKSYDSTCSEDSEKNAPGQLVFSVLITSILAISFHKCDFFSFELVQKVKRIIVAQYQLDHFVI